MSGHSKWSTIKHAKGAADVVKGRAFTIAARAISIAVSEGGGVGDPNHNFRLRLAIEKARELNVPKENIARAIEKGKGVGADALVEVVYEAYGPHGIALLIEAATDNKQRTVSVVKNAFHQAGFSLATPGAVSYLFTRSGILTVPKQGQSLDSIMNICIDAGADDVVETADMFEIYCPVQKLSGIKDALAKQAIPVDNTEIIMKANTPVAYDDPAQGEIDAFVRVIENLDDVQSVYTNSTH